MLGWVDVIPFPSNAKSWEWTNKIDLSLGIELEVEKRKKVEFQRVEENQQTVLWEKDQKKSKKVHFPLHVTDTVPTLGNLYFSKQ